MGVCSNLLSDTLRDAYVQEVADDYAKARAIFEGRGEAKLLPIADAREQRHRIDWARYTPPTPAWVLRFTTRPETGTGAIHSKSASV